uniref:ATP synthase F0 subunit 8 n=1 Tax=Ceutorhynchus parvulus TaxID=1587154 RepID=A0A343C4H3_9CUCU|nr:ATP synthase F0 subunit 8 [Ceutorhynchus parvulus]
MPQMAPLSWMSLYTLFISLLIIMIIMNYYMQMYTPKSYTMKNMMKIIKWKW